MKHNQTHLSSTSNHVLNVIGVTRAVHVRVVSVLGLILNVGGIDSNTTSTLLRRLINIFVSHGLGLAHLRQDLGNSSGKSGLAVIDVTNGTNVHVGLRTNISTQVLEGLSVKFNCNNVRIPSRIGIVGCTNLY